MEPRVHPDPVYRRPDQSARAIALPLPATSQWLPAIFAALAIGGICTQALAIATGSDYAFGLIPKLNPAGPRNIPIWLSSVAFAASAAAAAAIGFGRGRDKQWRALALLFLVLSIE